jgi:hypothetical protein
MSSLRVCQRRTIALLLGLLRATLLLPGSSTGAQVAQKTKVVLVASTFTPQALRELQPVADQVSQIVDELVPGTPPDYPPGGIICFEAPARWTTPAYTAMASDVPPVTIVGPRISDEPPEAIGNAVRIAVHDVQAPDRWRFAFQLSHELAHVKMGARSDNYLDETFATALSFEVLRRLGYEGYLLISEGTYLHQLPSEPQKALALGDWSEAQTYWLGHSKTQGQRKDDRPFQTLGAVLILRKRRGPQWTELLNASSANVCASSLSAGTFRVCDPDLSKMRGQKSFLLLLGYRAEDMKGKHVH